MRMMNLSLKVVLGCLVLTMALTGQSGWAAAEEKVEKTPIDLNGSEWNIELTLVEKSGKTSTSPDILVFEKGQFFSQSFRKDGYEPTNYSVSLNEDDSTKFGTMQNQGDETVYWEGRVRNKEVMDGSVYIYSKKVKGVKKEYYFNGKISKGELKAKAPIKATADGPVKMPAPKPQVEKEQVQEVPVEK